MRLLGLLSFDYHISFASCFRIIAGIPLSSENEEQLLSSWMWIGAFIVEIFILCYSCSLTKTEFGKIGCNLHKFALDLDSKHCKMKVRYQPLVGFILIFS